MPLANGVVLVNGIRRSALYDLHGGRVQRVPGDFADLAEWESLELARPRNKQIVEYLIRAGFYVRHESPFSQPFTVDGRYPLLPRFHTVSADTRAFKMNAFLPWLEEGLLHGWVKHLVSYDWSGTESTCSELAAICAKWGVSGTAACFDRADMSLISVNGRGEIVKAERLSTCRTRLKLAAGIAQYSTLRTCSELAGQIHVDAELSIWPDAQERYYRYGDVHSCSLRALIVTQKVLDAFANVKSKRDTCRDCELRYCCFYPFSSRQVSTDIASAPVDCGYDPRSESWQNQVFAELPI